MEIRPVSNQNHDMAKKTARLRDRIYHLIKQDTPRKIEVEFKMYIPKNFKEYGRNQSKGKEYINQPGILHIRADISKAKYKPVFMQC